MPQRNTELAISSAKNIDINLVEGNAVLVQLTGNSTPDGTVDFQSTIDGVNYTNTPYIQPRVAAPSRSVAQLTSITTLTEYLLVAPLTQVRIAFLANTTGTLDVVWREVLLPFDPTSSAASLAFLASVGGALDDAAAAGAVTTSDTAMAYLKQIINNQEGGPGIVTWPAGAAPADGVSLSEGIRKIAEDLVIVDEFHDVPAADNTLNAQINEVIGNKTDAAAAGAVTTTDTLVGYIKQLITAAELTGSATAIGKRQVATTTEDLNQCAGDFDLLTGTTQDFMLTALSFKMPNVNVADDCNITSISIQTDDVTKQTIISSTDGAIANLTAEAELSWTGRIKITTGTKIQLTIAGGSADATTTTLITAEGYAIVAGGNLA